VTATVSTYCGHCGLSLAGGAHEVCRWRAELEPPRYCSECGRRMVVQVTPDRWTARCAAHGATTVSTWTGG
jgi:hypothetical protein